jgi:formylmethanofuran dehydrogenase subunit B
MSSREPRRITCAACGLLCDDLTAVTGPDGRLRLEPACPRGEAWLAARVDPGVPVARVGGRETGLDEALDTAAAILAGARSPLVYGLGETSIEAQRAAVALADGLGAMIDPAGPALDGAAGRAFQARGGSTATLGDIRDRAEVVVVWRADPVTTHPRLLERLRLPAEGRTLVVVDAERTATAERADVFLAVPEERDVDALGVLRALIREAPFSGDPPVAGLDDLGARLRDCANGAILHHIRDHVAAMALSALVRDLDTGTHIVTAVLRHEGNAAGAEDVLAWQTGYPSAVSLAPGHPVASPGELSAAAVLARGDADAALVVGSDPLEHLPAAAADALRAIPVVTVDGRATTTAEAARVAFTTAAAGVHRAGVAHRLDGVPVPLHPVAGSDRPGDDEILAALAERLARTREATA